MSSWRVSVLVSDRRNQSYAQAAASSGMNPVIQQWIAHYQRMGYDWNTAYHYANQYYQMQGNQSSAGMMNAPPALQLHNTVGYGSSVSQPRPPLSQSTMGSTMGSTTSSIIGSVNGATLSSIGGTTTAGLNNNYTANVPSKPCCGYYD